MWNRIAMLAVMVLAGPLAVAGVCGAATPLGTYGYTCKGVGKHPDPKPFLIRGKLKLATVKAGSFTIATASDRGSGTLVFDKAISLSAQTQDVSGVIDVKNVHGTSSGTFSGTLTRSRRSHYRLETSFTTKDSDGTSKGTMTATK